MKKKLLVFVPIFLCALLVVVSITPTITMSESISQKVFRLHILANSDSQEDQQLKLRVRDKILQESEEMFSSCNSVDEAINISRESIDKLKNISRQVIAYYNYDYDVRAYVTKEYFETREYDNFTLPAGIYDCLKIEIGQGKGHNWWCVMYPSVCISGCTDDFDLTLTEDEKQLIESDNYVIKFKVVEIYEKIKSKFA